MIIKYRYKHLNLNIYPQPIISYVILMSNSKTYQIYLYNKNRIQLFVLMTSNCIKVVNLQA